MNTIIFTDGASRGNPGKGGWGAIIISNETVHEIGGREEHTTNNRMELCAVIGALKTLIEKSNIRVYSDSSYVINGATKWIYGWKKNNWKTAEKKDVVNQDLWESLSNLLSVHKVSFEYVGGHVGIVGNERCDEIATSFADGTDPHLFSGAFQAYPLQHIRDVGSVSEKVEKKKSKSNSGDKKAYSYVSSVGGVVSTDATWGECEKKVKGKSGAKFKKVFSKEEESELMAVWSKRN